MRSALHLPILGLTQMPPLLQYTIALLIGTQLQAIL